MVKNLKLKIKNEQIAGAFKINKPIITKNLETAKKSTTERVEKPKVRIMATHEEKPEEEKIHELKAEQEISLPIESPKEEVVILPPPVEEKKIEPVVQHKQATPEGHDKKPVQKPIPVSKKPEEKAKETTPPKKKGVVPGAAFKDFNDFKSTKKKGSAPTSFDSRDRQGLRDSDDEKWRKKRFKPLKKFNEETIIRPKHLKVRLPITIKNLAQDMKRKASEIIAKLFMQGMVVTLNDALEDETTVQLIGQDFDCQIEIDTTEERLLKITDKTIQEEINANPPELLKPRSVVLTFMGHVDHGKTSLIDAIRQSSVAETEAGAITQHIGAFKVKTDSSEVTILDTPGHEAFSEMRQRGANVTDIVILVVAGDEGIKEQTVEAIQQAKQAKVPILVAINKCDRENFDQEKVYRQLADIELLPEAWGGSTITVNCSAVTKQGIATLLEMAALQAEILELRANPNQRARGTILESQMHKGLGAVATCLIQNGTLKVGDAIVFGNQYGRIKTMHDEHLKPLFKAPPSTPVKVTGLSGLAEAGCEFIVVDSEKEAKKLSVGRQEGEERNLIPGKKKSLETLLKQEEDSIKHLAIILRTDVQGSLEALKNSLLKIKSNKVDISFISASIGQISESDIRLAVASKAMILGFHTSIEPHANPLIKEAKIPIHLHDIIYHAVDDVKEQMLNLLDKLEIETDKGTAQIKNIFKSSHIGKIAGCQVIEGTIQRNNHVRLIRDNKVIWKGKMSSLKREKEDVREVQKGIECGILLDHFKDIEEGDLIQAYEITYIKQSL